MKAALQIAAMSLVAQIDKVADDHAAQIAQLELTRRAGEAQELLRAAGVELRPLDGDQAAALLARALDPPGPPLGATLEGVVRAC